MVTTNLPNGVTNVLDTTVFGTFGAPDPSKYIEFFDDFMAYRVDAATTPVAYGDWLVTTTGSGTGVVTDENGGVVLVTNGASDDDNYFAQWQGGNAANVAETFKFIAKKQTWFKCRFKVSDATQSDIVIGLQITDTTPLAVTDGVYFLKADGSTTMNLLVTKNSTSTTTAAATIADATYITLGFVYNGSDRIDIYADDVRVASSVTTNLVDDEELAVSFGLQNGEAAAKTMNLDYIFVASER